MISTRLAILCGAVLVDMIGFGIVLPLLPFYAESMGATPNQVTLIIASYSAMQLAAAPIWGRISDRRGRRPLIIAGLFASAVSYLIFGLAETLFVLLASRIAAGAAGGTVSVAQAYVADYTEEEDRAHGLGLIGAASGLGVMLGPAIGGWFSQWGLGVPGFVAAALCLVNGIAALFFLPESTYEASEEEHEQGETASLSDWLEKMTEFPLSLLLIVYFLSISSFTAMTSVLALYVERVFDMDAADMGIVFTIAGGVTVVVRGGIVGRLARKLGEPFTVRAGAVILAVTLAGIPFMPTRWWLGLVIPGWALATGILFPSLASLVSRATDRRSQGSILGGSQIVGGTGRVLGPAGAGWLFQHVGIESPFLIGAAMVVVAALAALAIPRAGEGKKPGPIASKLSTLLGSTSGE